MTEIALTRLNEERRNWRKDPPVGFYARPMKNADNSTNMLKWECGIPGPEGSDWEGGLYKLTMDFSDDYPVKAPKCQFVVPLFHPNIFASGKICLSILKDEPGGWSPGISIRTLLLSLQDLLINPNVKDPAHFEASQLFAKKKSAYSIKVRAEALKHAPES